MADKVRAVDYYNVRMPDKPGAGAGILALFRSKKPRPKLKT